MARAQTLEPGRKSADALCERLGYEFSDPGVLRLALTHRSLGENNNERLEFLGDAVLGFLVADLLYSSHPNASEGELTRWRASLVRRESLAAIARELELGEVLRLGTGELKSGGRDRDSILANGLEAVLGALLLDGGVQACRHAIRLLYGERIAGIARTGVLKDAKTRLQEILQAHGRALPAYRVESVEGEAHKQHFIVCCEVEMFDRAVRGTGSSRRRAEQSAARAAIALLEDSGDLPLDESP
ncbi:MAG: ribonuclease III [Gammaproteobacteria bacterium]